MPILIGSRKKRLDIKAPKPSDRAAGERDVQRVGGSKHKKSEAGWIRTRHPRISHILYLNLFKFSRRP